MPKRHQQLSEIGEFGFIDWIQERSAKTHNSSVLKGIGDDTAVCRHSQKEHLLLTTDMLVESVHFNKGMGALKIGWKALACSISDVAAMGGVPKQAVISFGAPPSTHLDFIKNIYKGIIKAAKQFDVAIVGGDTVRTSKVVINIALTGCVVKKHLVLRSTARTGDQIFVTGSLGSSLKRGKHLNFVPRVKEAQYLVKKFKPTSMIDISDGLVADLYHILEQSKVGAKIWENKVRKAPQGTFQNALYDGEDFELLFTLNSKDAKRLQDNRQPFTFIPIGEIISDKNRCVCVMNSGKEVVLKNKGYVHF